ncbi:endolytic transglycosylase MltG [Clostridium sp. CM028]|uniref:endolytic transglycosylase MltG n=1 Tax=unclassified Clostridium TaxID=2614128 RepID=UPI001C0DF446|nr:MULTISPECIES: endolytic transglycosylase MltG [unclassified Clostridium]MBU3091937.1 endolytic transglycosylase MltG [Clostridium sp. CF011]MBW9145692.1 endolytic transglycosylase MltG [Clostridium sp. CM027]MBW9149542.1 endolytic transglycosylase MltG [Clostridium sp. CM028]UVE41458.1 endolytic transglycosylase MltG [Clostridium sp. CM027]WAG70452.1 endolytic transglycosylase MltG [Clostridium sp. CF011]
MKKIVLLIMVLIVCVLAGNFQYKKIIQHPIKTNKDIYVNVKNGDALYSVLDDLNQIGAIKNASIIKFYIKSNKIKSNVHTGKFLIPKDVTVVEFIKILSTVGNEKDIIKVTIPEGFDINSIANMLQEKGIINKEKFIDSCKTYKLPTYITEKENRKFNLEGFLFPSTYDLKAGMSGNAIIKLMVDKFYSTINEINKETPIEMKKLDDIIIMASIVERETSDKNEKAKVASVFYNRLKKDMKLQSCATVLYSLGKHKEKLYNKDLEVKSPYNTYKVTGLPVGPICNPGKESIKAALSPTKTNYLYFVLSNDGKHFFTDDYNEFLKVKDVTQGF